jgi:hypothetical protein
MNIAVSEDLRRLLRKKVENGQFPNEESVVEEALKCFLIQGPNLGRAQTITTTESPEERLPGPFIEDDTMVAPVELSGNGREVACSFLPDATRQPSLFPGE